MTARLALAAALAAPVLAGHHHQDGSAEIGTRTYTLALQQCNDGDDWTLHGLWPEHGSTCTHVPFDDSALDSMKSDLHKRWDSCPAFHQKDDDFWSHEWKQHGVCSGLKEADFFTEGLALQDKFKSICATAGSNKSCRLACSGTSPDITCEPKHHGHGHELSLMDRKSHHHGHGHGGDHPQPGPHGGNHSQPSGGPRVWTLAMQQCHPDHDEFTLHGLWIDQGDTCVTSKFDESSLAPMMDDLDKYWMSCGAGRGNTWFWTHEWEKHGRCSGMDERTFFKTTLDLRAKYAPECKQGSVCKMHCTGSDQSITCAPEQSIQYV